MELLAMGKKVVAQMCIAVWLLVSSLPAMALYEKLLLPAPVAVDTDILQRYWDWLIIETGAPQDLPLPPVVIESLPDNVKMGLYFPTARLPDVEFRIAVSIRAMNRAETGERLTVLSEIAHELVHYILLVSEHDWVVTRHRFNPARHRHCDEQFRRLNLHVAEIIWDAYHSNDTRRSVNQMVQKACWEEGHYLSGSDGY